MDDRFEKENMDSVAPEPACPICGATKSDLYTHGQMGCAQCYEVFAEEVIRALREIHGTTQHIGKA